MRTYLLTATALTCLAVTPSYAQKTTATGTGVGVSEANSASGAIAVSKGNGNGNQLTINNPANTTSHATVNSNVSGTTTSNVNSRVSGTQTIKSNPSLAVGLSAAGLETCLGSASGGLSLAGFGAVGGSTYVDEGCQARLDSRTLASYGLKAAAVARLCQRADIWRSMPDICYQYWPREMPLPHGITYAEPAGYTAPMPVRALMSADSAAGAEAIRVIDGRDGVEKDCLNYSHTKQKCYRWSGEMVPRKRTTVAAVTPSKTLPKPKLVPIKRSEEPVPAVTSPAELPVPVKPDDKS